MTSLATVLAILVVLDVFLWSSPNEPKEDAVPEAKVVRRG